jgi:hypothetical protein
MPRYLIGSAAMSKVNSSESLGPSCVVTVGAIQVQSSPPPSTSCHVIVPLFRKYVGYLVSADSSGSRSNIASTLRIVVAKPSSITLENVPCQMRPGDHFFSTTFGVASNALMPPSGRST